jgi:phage gp36-like protein
MARQYTATNEVIERLGGASRFETLTGYDPTQAAGIARMEQANAFAVSRMESFISNRYAVPLDAPLPPVIHEAVLALEVEHLTRSSDRRPAVIKETEEAAVADLQKIERGHMSIPDTDPSTPGGQHKAALVFGAPRRIFDFDNPRSEGSRVLPPVGPAGSGRKKNW